MVVLRGVAVSYERGTSVGFMVFRVAGAGQSRGAQTIGSLNLQGYFAHQKQPTSLQGYLAHKKQHPPLGPPWGPRRMLLKGPSEGLFLMSEVPV